MKSKQFAQCRSPVRPISGNSTWGSSGMLRQGRGGTSFLCSSESLPVPFPVSMSPMHLNGWLNPSLNFQRRVTSEACQATVSTIMTERSQWVMVFCLFTLLSSLIISSLSISSEPPSSPSAWSPPLSLFGFDWSPSAEEVTSPDFVKASGFWSRSLPFNDSTCQ